MRTKQQIEILDQIVIHRRILALDERDSPVWPDKVDITVTTKGDDDHLFVYQINPFGVTEEAEYKLCRYEQFVGWESETNSWHGSVPLIGKQNGGLTPKEESGDESFDVVVENKIKEEKKMDFTDRIYDRYLERVRQYVSDNADELREYKAELLEEKVDDITDDEIEHDVKAVIDGNVEYESVSDLINIDNCDIEDILNDYDIL